MNKLLFGVLLACVLLQGCINSQSQSSPVSGQSIAVDSASSSQVKEFSLISNSFTFDPSTIEVNEGDKVRVKINNVDTIGHGFAVLDFGVNTYLGPGKTETVEFTASKKGEFNFFCSFFCGKGHRDMKGKLVVK